MTDTDSLAKVVAELRAGAGACASELPQTSIALHIICERIDRLDAEMRKPAGESQTTHWEDCWKDRGHHACAVARIAEFSARLAACENALRDIACAGSSVPHGMDEASFNRGQFYMCIRTAAAALAAQSSAKEPT